MAISTLAAIQTKVRRLTRSPSVSQITDTQINEYINTFMAYDLPSELRLFNLHGKANLQLNAYQAEYDLSTLTDDNGETLINSYITINPPVYVDGYEAFFTQSRDEFFNLYPQVKNLVLMGTGDAVTTVFTKTIANGFLIPNQVVVSSIDANDNSLYMQDDGAGAFTGDGIGSVDYVTGAISVTFNTAPGSSDKVNAHIIQYTPGRPSAVLYYENKLTVRNIPDQPYTLNFEYYKEATQLAAGESPQIKQWWQYIAYGTAKKIFEDRMDIESVQMIMPEFKKQERFVLRRTLVQQANQRTATIYSQQTGLQGGFNNFYTGF